MRKHVPLATALGTAGRQQTDPPNSATSFLQACPERRILAVNPHLPILKKLTASDAIVTIHLKMEWTSTIFPTRASRAIFFVSASSPHAWQTQRHHVWRALQLEFHAKPIQQMGLPTKSQSRDPRPMVTLRYPSRRNRDTNHDVAHSLTPFSQTSCSIRSSFHIFRNQDEQFVLCHFIIFIVIFRDIKLQITVIDRNKLGPDPLDQGSPVTRVFQRFRAHSCTHHTECDAGRVQTQHGVQLPAWSVHVRPQQQWSLKLHRFIINACIQSLVFNRTDLQLCF